MSLLFVSAKLPWLQACSDVSMQYSVAKTMSPMHKVPHRLQSSRRRVCGGLLLASLAHDAMLEEQVLAPAQTPNIAAVSSSSWQPSCSPRAAACYALADEDQLR
jgi:hypothetical protein